MVAVLELSDSIQNSKTFENGQRHHVGSGSFEVKMIKAKYKRNVVTGEWFRLGDGHYLLLTEAAARRVKMRAIPIDKLTNISRYP